MKINPNIWLGDETSCALAIEAMDKAADYMQANNKAPLVLAASSEEFDEEEYDHMYSVRDGVATIEVRGSLVNAQLGMIGSWFGVVGYGDIANCLVEAVRDGNVTGILLRVASGGGSVAGVTDMGNLVAAVNKIKPIHAYASGSMCSAAYWLSCPASAITAGDVSTVGSIGAVQIIASRAKMLEENGVEVKVVRSGKYKMLNNGVEPISDALVEEIQAQVDYIDGMFNAFVAQHRGGTAASVRTKYGQGRVFLGQQAVDVGLVDRVESMAGALVALKTRTASANRNKLVVSHVAAGTIAQDNSTKPKGSDMYTEEELAAMAAAGIDAQAAIAAAAAGTGATAPAAPAAPEGTAPEATNGDPEQDADVESDSALAAAQAQVAELTAAVAAADAKAVDAAAKVADLQGQLDAAAAKATETDKTQAALEAIVAGSLKAMSVALNATADATLKGQELVAAHAEMADKFKSKFKAGGVAAAKPAVTETEKTTQASATVNPLFIAAATMKQSKGK